MPHRFKDEWLTGLLTDLPGVTASRIAGWRKEERPYLVQAVVDAELATFDDLAQRVRKRFGIESADLGTATVSPKLLGVVPEKICRAYDLVPLQLNPHDIVVATPNPLNADAEQQVRWASGRDMQARYTLPEMVEGALSQLATPEAVVYNLLRRFGPDERVELVRSENATEDEERRDQVRTPVIQLVNGIILKAIRGRASDIHIEHEETTTHVRFRVDGILKRAITLPRYIGAGPLVARIKIMASLDISERMRPQDGRAKLRVGGTEFALRVSTLPTPMGEKVVMRILDERSAQVSLERIGLPDELLTRYRRLLAREQGILLVTGPTGSGKTTTLYASLNVLRNETVNIVTVEDPIEYRLEGISQVHVNEKQGLTFASVLRSVLRQDPDVIMVGEIRDAATADIALQAALTGHLVLSTLHTTDTVGAVIRLADMGVERQKIAAGLMAVTAQRLVRRLCTACAAEVAADQIDAGVRTAMERVHGSVRAFRPVGCQACAFSGYINRVPLVELLEIGAELRERISAGDSAEQLHALASATGALLPLWHDALRHVHAGTTSVEEVLPYLAEELARMDAVARQPQPGSAPTEGPTVQRAGLKQTRILIADSDAARAAATIAALASAGAESVQAANGKQAITRLGMEPIDALIVSSRLDGADAKHVVQAARGLLGLTDLPILAIAAADDDDAQLLEAAGTDDVLTGAPSAERVVAAVQALLARRNAWAEADEIGRPRVPANEADRIAALHATDLLDTDAEERFDHITRTAQRLFKAPIALVTLVDAERQWFKSRQGLDAPETPRDQSFCAHAIHTDEPLVVPDAALDPRFWDNPLVTGDPKIRFYAGSPIHGPGGHRLGTLCVIDRVPRNFSPEELESLNDLARLAEKELRPTR